LILQPMTYRPRAIGIGVLVAIAAIAPGCGTASRLASTDTGLQQLTRAVQHATEARTFRVKGALRVGFPLVQWQGVVNGQDEQYLIRANGLLIESRRVNRTSWARRLDPPEPWQRVPYDSPLDLTVLTRGTIESVEHDRVWTITLRFEDVDVLAAMTHIPSVGPTTAEVTVEHDVLTNVALHLGDHADAEISLSEFGAPLRVEPVTNTARNS
jgi:hypothetical protein